VCVSCSAAFPIKDLELVEHRVQETERKRKASRTKMLSATRAMLKEFHRNLNEKLAQLLDDDQFTWPELSTPDIGGDNEAPVTHSVPPQPALASIPGGGGRSPPQ